VRLWTLHPSYLDSRGLVAFWREGLLAQAVLRGRTVGYRHHPQLERFRAAARPLAAIAAYLLEVKAESLRRGFRFDAKRIGRTRDPSRLTATTGQLEAEWRHLAAKLKSRDPAWLASLPADSPLRQHPLFDLVPGGRAGRERAPGEETLG
jgi:hypothetical protein